MNGGTGIGHGSGAEARSGRDATTRSYGSFGPISWCWVPGLFWFRIFGKGWHFRDTTRHRLLFSERNGDTPMWTIRRLK